MAARKTDARRLGRKGYAVFLWLGVAYVFSYFLLPSTDAQLVAYIVPGVAAAIAIGAGILIWRPAQLVAWVIILVGRSLVPVGDSIWAILELRSVGAPFPSLADAAYIGGNLLTLIGVWLLVRSRVTGHDRAATLDAIIITVGAGLVSWQFLIAPVLGGPPVEAAVALAYPLVDLLALALVVRVGLQGGPGSTALWFATIALALYLLADFPYGYMSLIGAYRTGQILDAGWLLGAVFWGAAALHPSMATVAFGRAQTSDTPFSVYRLGLLTLASLMAPTLLVFQWARGVPIDVPLIALASAVLFTLVIARLYTVATDLRSVLAHRGRLQQELEHQAWHDSLTGLPNRRLFQSRLEQALGSRVRPAVLFIDLDDFKAVNDTAGHAAGDELLRHIAGRMMDVLRHDDVPARLGGDEFAVLLTTDGDAARAEAVAGRLISAIAQPVTVAGRQWTPGVSVGIRIGLGDSDSAETMMRDADIAMYLAKTGGKHRSVRFDGARHRDTVRDLDYRVDLARAVRDREFELRYQPIVDLQSGVVGGAEALVRWRHPTRGLIHPSEFIAVAEATGDILGLGRWVLEEACARAADWPRGHARNAVSVSVNVSAVQLADPKFAAMVTAALASAGLPPERLILEITETAFVSLDVSLPVLRRLPATGVQLAIDDFGTGHASLNQLASLPFDIIKIDRSFVTRLSDSRTAALVETIVSLASRFGASAVAEGIEKEEERAQLLALGCRVGQGFYFGHPLAEPDFVTLLTDGAPSAQRSRASSLHGTPERGVRP